jgi:hypothetical protein
MWMVRRASHVPEATLVLLDLPLYLAPPASSGSVAARKDDAPAAGQAAITNIASVTPFSGGGGLIQTTSG